MFDYTSVLKRDLARGLSRIAATHSRYALIDFGIEVPEEDIASELYMVILARPELKDYFLGKALSILKAEAKVYICKQRDQRGGFFTSPALLTSLLRNWRVDGLPASVQWCLYDAESKFADDGIPAGSYRQVIEDAYWGGLMPDPRSAQGKKLKRAVARLAEVLSGVLVGPVRQLEENDYEVALEYDEGSSDYEDLEFSAGSFGALYSCPSGHINKFYLAAQPPELIGSVRGVYGLRYCSCGEVLKLAQ